MAEFAATTVSNYVLERGPQLMRLRPFLHPPTSVSRLQKRTFRSVTARFFPLRERAYRTRHL